MTATSTNFQVSPRKNSKRSLLQGFASDIGGLLSAFSILVAIIITLGIFNGKPEQDWKLKMNLNSLVALITTILRAPNDDSCIRRFERYISHFGIEIQANFDQLLVNLNGRGSLNFDPSTIWMFSIKRQGACRVL